MTSSTWSPTWQNVHNNSQTWCLHFGRGVVARGMCDSSGTTNFFSMYILYSCMSCVCMYVQYCAQVGNDHTLSIYVFQTHPSFHHQTRNRLLGRGIPKRTINRPPKMFQIQLILHFSFFIGTGNDFLRQHKKQLF